MEELVENEDEEEMSGEYEMDTGVLDTISQQFESLDYFTNYSSLLLDEIRMIIKYLIFWLFLRLSSLNSHLNMNVTNLIARLFSH